METKFGLDQVNNPAPAWIKRTLRAAIFLFTSIGTFIATIPTDVLSDHRKVLVGVIASFILLMIQAMEILFGVASIEAQHSPVTVSEVEPEAEPEAKSPASSV